MTDPVTGTFGAAVLDGWIGTDPRGGEMAFLMLSTPGTPGTDTEAAMTIIATAFGTGPGQVQLNAADGLNVEVDAAPDAQGDRWARLNLPGGEHLARPVNDEWAQLALARGQVMLCIGIAPRRSAEDAFAYTDRTYATAALVLLPLAPTGSPGRR